ncbi:MAG: hypothetical protein B6I18_05400 [Bacteroidetes bacterium 4572_112]|nr:MAG: hypothetical protein B6I18_05400 [Bacteroidetes bacterium 4572_112]
MQITKPILKNIPEIILFSLIIMYWIDTSFLNPIAFFFFTILIIKILVKNTIVNFISVGIFFVTAIYLLLAVLSEYHEFIVKSSDAQSLLYVGLMIFALILISTIGMGIKSIKNIS